MKKLIAIIALTLFASVSFAAEQFVPLTKDNEVTSVDQIRVKKVTVKQVEEEVIYSITEIDANIATIQARIDHLQGDIDVLNVLKANVQKEVEKVKLKSEEVPVKEMEVK